jgi:hypothetical protein
VDPSSTFDAKKRSRPSDRATLTGIGSPKATFGPGSWVKLP